MGLDVTGGYRYPAPRADWLATHREEVIDPGLPMIDPHHHLWREAGNPYLLDDLAADLSTGHNIVATVFVECHHAYRTDGPERLRSVGETETAEATRRLASMQAHRATICAGIVAHADLTLGERVEAVIEAHRSASPGHLRGIRQSVARDSHFPDGIVLRPAPAGMLGMPAFRRGLRQVARSNLTFDAMIYHEQLRDLADAARSVPELDIVLDHFGCPIGVGPYEDRGVERFQAWERDIRELARCPNVVVKMGGLGMIVTGARYHLEPRPPSSEELAADWRPWFEVCVEAFGAARCMFESNFPADKAMFSYPVLWNAFKRLASGASVEERRDLFAGTAARMYGLSDILAKHRSTG